MGTFTLKKGIVSFLLWEVGNRDPISRMLYADALVANGDTVGAAEILSELYQEDNLRPNISEAERRLMYQAWYRYTLAGDLPRAIAAWQTVLLLNPENVEAAQGLAEAQKRLK